MIHWRNMKCATTPVINLNLVVSIKPHLLDYMNKTLINHPSSHLLSSSHSSSLISAGHRFLWPAENPSVWQPVLKFTQPSVWQIPDFLHNYKRRAYLLVLRSSRTAAGARRRCQSRISLRAAAGRLRAERPSKETQGDAGNHTPLPYKLKRGVCRVL